MLREYQEEITKLKELLEKGGGTAAGMEMAGGCNFEQ